MAGRFSGGRLTHFALAFLLSSVALPAAPTLAQSNAGAAFATQRDPVLLNEAGWAAIRTRNYEKAKSDFDAALAAEPNMLEARRGMARAFAGLGSLDEAFRIIEPLREVSPVFMLENASLLLVAERPERALAEIDRAMRWAGERAQRIEGGRIGRRFEKRAAMLRGDALYMLGGYDAALEQFELAHRIVPGAASWRAIGDSFMAMNRLPEAHDAYSEALKLRPSDGLAFQRRARVRAIEGDTEGAIADYAGAELSLADNRSFLAEYSETLLEAQAYGDGVAALNRLLPLTKNDPNAGRAVRYHLASALIEAGRLREAEDQIALIDGWKGMEVPILFQRGRAKFGLGDFQQSYNIFSAALEIRRGDPTLLYGRGLASLRMGNIERALDDLAEASVRAPQDSRIRDAIGQIKLYQGRTDEGIAFYNAGVAAHRDDPAPLIQRARAYLSIGKAEAALADADSALALDPDAPDAAVVAATAYLQLGDPAESLRYSDRLIASRTRKREGYLLRARAAIASGSPNEGLSAIEQARNFGAPETKLAMLEGDAHIANDAYEEALVSYDRAIILNPNLAQSRIKRGDALVELNRLEAAEADYAVALSLIPGSTDLRMKQAEVLRQNGNCTSAITAYDIVLETDPEHAQALRGRGKCKMSDGPFLGGLSDMISSFF